MKYALDEKTWWAEALFTPGIRVATPPMIATQRRVPAPFPIATTIATAMPIYEFECQSCGERSEALVDLGTETIDCRHCGSPATHRVLSAQAPSMRLVKSRGDTRKQEASNAGLHETAKDRFKEARRKQREKRSGGGK